MSDNGALAHDVSEVQVSATVLRRLARLHARAEGLQLAVQAVSGALQQAQNALREALTEACEEQGMALPGGGTAPVDVDWRTGVITLSPPPPGLAMPPPPAPTEPAAESTV